MELLSTRVPLLAILLPLSLYLPHAALDLVHRVGARRSPASAAWLLGGALALGTAWFAALLVALPASPTAAGTHDPSLIATAWLVALGASFGVLGASAVEVPTLRLWAATALGLLLGLWLCAAVLQVSLLPVDLWAWVPLLAPGRLLLLALFAVVYAGTLLQADARLRVPERFRRLAPWAAGIAFIAWLAVLPPAAAVDPDVMVFASGVPTLHVALLAGSAALLMLAGAHVVSRMDRRLMQRADALERSLRQANEDLQKIAYNDALTALPNRLVFEDKLASAVAAADRSAGRLAVLFIDLDGFKPINDSLGHSSGDAVLRQVGARLRTLARAEDTMARVGGDEFLMLLTGAIDEESAAHVAARVLATLGEPYALGSREVTLSCSIGIVFYPDGGAHTKLIARADAAMYAAKRTGGACYCFFERGMEANAHEQLDLQRDLRHAIENQELELFYQPKIDSHSGKVTAAEALLRWKHPQRGMISPATFIPIAERFGLIGALGNWVIEDACRQARYWREHGMRMRVAINLSPVQMRQDDLVERIVDALERHRIQPSLLTCEITESVAMEDTRATQSAFRRLGEAGVHLSIDDFGTGYSSLAYLRKLPAEELKIDRSFVMDIEHSLDARAVVDAVVRLAHALGLKVVAEGVETERQREILVGMGCDELQGYLFAKPMSARALLIWASDDRERETAFMPSLFGETRPVTRRDEQTTRRQWLSTGSPG
ncbi:MAG TPA: bifunctional diguanylate cyclase/phosphodiesterase [Burkholderiaceae bacterium]